MDGLKDVSGKDALVILNSLMEHFSDADAIEKNRKERDEMAEAREIIGLMRSDNGIYMMERIERGVFVSPDYVSEHCNISQVDAVNSLERMRELGLVSRETIDLCDRYSLTEFGAKLLNDQNVRNIIYK